MPGLCSCLDSPNGLWGQPNSKEVIKVYHKILMAIDGSKHSAKVIEHVLFLAEALKAEVTVMTVTGDYDFKSRISLHMSDEYWEQVKSNLYEDGKKIVEKAAEQFRAKDLPVETLILVGKQSPPDAICKAADRGDYDLVVLGNHGLRGLSEAFLGSVSNKVTHCTKKNVMIIK